MATYKIRVFFILILSIFFLFSFGCEGPAGPQGPLGEQGPQGAHGTDGQDGQDGTDGQDGQDGTDGQDGQDGTDGQDGEPGTANVIYSEWTAFDLNNWTDSFTFFGQTRRNYPVSEEKIDTEILSSGAVMVYVRFGGTSNTIQPLPVIGPITATTSDQVLNFNLQIGGIVILFHNLIERDVDPGRLGSGNNYRYIIIPGGVQAKVSPDFPDLNDYYAVTEYYGIDP